MKTAVTVIVGLVLGVVVGAIGVHQWLMPQLMIVESQLSEAQRSLENLKVASTETTDKLARLEQEREAYNDRLEAAEARAAAAQKSAFVAPVEPELELDATDVEALAVDDAEPRDSDRPERGRGRDDRWGGTPEERDARRQEFVTRMQDNMTSFFTGELEKSSTPAMQDRLLALEEKTYEMFELRSQMRQAETDEEREQLGQAFGDSMTAARQLMVEQQEDMINAIASQFGIAKESDQAAFEQAVRSAITSPFFSDNPGALLWNAGRTDEGGGGFGGGYRGGPGGDRGGSGGDRRGGR